MKTMSRMGACLTLGLGISIAAGTSAFAQVAGPSCTAPSKPASLKTKEEVNDFSRRMEAYQGCIMDYVKEQQRLSKAHGEAANEAIQKWNKYVADMNKKPIS